MAILWFVYLSLATHVEYKVFKTSIVAKQNNVPTLGDGITLHGCDLDYADYNVSGILNLEAIPIAVNVWFHMGNRVQYLPPPLYSQILLDLSGVQLV